MVSQIIFSAKKEIIKIKGITTGYRGSKVVFPILLNWSEATAPQGNPCIMRT